MEQPVYTALVRENRTVIDAIAAAFPLVMEQPVCTKLVRESRTVIDTSAAAFSLRMEQPVYTELVRENRTVIDTNAAAFYLSRKPQTLRKWACFEDGPLRPIRIHGRLAWNVADIKRLVSEGSAG